MVALAAQAPAMAASPPNQQFGVVFDGGGGANGYLNSAYLNLRSTTGSPVTLTAPVTLTIDVAGLNPTNSRERSFTAGSSNGSISRTYDSSTRITTILWTLPVGTVVPTTYANGANPDILFTFNDGGLSNRITNKIVVRAIAGGRITQLKALPIDSSVVKDYDKGAVSPDGIY